MYDNKGHRLSPKQAEYFKDSTVVDGEGRLKVMYHGTPRGGFREFHTHSNQYANFGAGSYFTDRRDRAEIYANKFQIDSPQIYEVYLNISRPMDMDADANPKEWSGVMPEVDFPAEGYNEDYYFAAAQYYERNGKFHYEASEIIRGAIEKMGYDGITYIHCRSNTTFDDERVYVAFEPEQIKRTMNFTPKRIANIDG